MLQDDEIDALLGDENDTFFDSIRSKRLEELSSKAVNFVKANFDAANDYDTWGYLTEIGHEKEVLHLSTSVPRLLIHFYNPAFKNCQLLNEHLQVTIMKKFSSSLLFTLFRKWLKSSQLLVSSSLKPPKRLS